MVAFSVFNISALILAQAPQKHWLPYAKGVLWHTLVMLTPWVMYSHVMLNFKPSMTKQCHDLESAYLSCGITQPSNQATKPGKGPTRLLNVRGKRLRRGSEDAAIPRKVQISAVKNSYMPRASYSHFQSSCPSLNVNEPDSIRLLYDIMTSSRAKGHIDRAWTTQVFNAGFFAKNVFPRELDHQNKLFGHKESGKLMENWG